MKIFPGKILLFILAILLNLSAYTQEDIQRLKNQYWSSQSDSIRLKAVLKIIVTESNADSVLAYILEAIRFSAGTSEVPDVFYGEMCALLEEHNMYDDAVQMRKRSAAWNHQNKRYKESASDRIRAAYILTLKGLFKESIQELTDVLEYTEKYNLEALKGRIYLIFGFAYRAFDFERALKYFTLCMESCDDDTLNNDLNYALNEIGNLYITQGDFKKAEQFLFRSLKIRETIGSPALLSYSYHDIASMYSESGNYREAIDWFLKSAEITEQQNDLWGLAITYCSIGRAYRNSKAYSSAESYLHKAMEIARKINMKTVYQTVYLEMYEFYQEREDYRQALFCYKQQKYYNDSIFEEEKQQQLKVLESRFESLQKDREISKQKEKLNQQRQLMFSAIVFIVLLLAGGVFIYRQYLYKKRLSNMLTEQNAEIESQRDEIATQRDEIASQRDQVTEQKNQIQEILADVTSSIRYAQRIQEAMLPTLEMISDAGIDHFVFYKPSEIVSGDFYWAGQRGNEIIVTVADCTGHGVPGAFMSMLGMTLIKEITSTRGVSNPAEILAELRREIIKALHQEKEKNQRDGMDIALCTINIDTLELQFAGANNPLYIIKPAISHWPLAVGQGTPEANSQWPMANSQQPIASSQLIELKGDKMPIGIYERMDNFTLHKYQLQKGDCIYLFSDGFADQFGGSDGKKYKNIRLKTLLQSICLLSPAEQKRHVVNSFNEWRGTYRQVDDVTILGLKI
jgi:serine phosphatase RsbU (regulator of sigma subunit)